MKRYLILIVLLVSFAGVRAYSQDNSWNSLTPLHSTRSDVERVLGKPKEFKPYIDYKTESDYVTKEGEISVKYISYNCESGWNVPKDTVLRISIVPISLVGKSSSEIGLDLSDFRVGTTDALFGSWTNSEQGLSYSFSGVSREFISMSYIPKKSDNNLRCNGFPPYSPETHYFTMETYPFFDLNISRKANLRTTLSQLEDMLLNVASDETKEYKAYVLVYFDNKLPLSSYQKQLAETKKIAFRRYKLSPNEVMFIEGGMMKDSLMELYLIKKDNPPPTPLPTLPSPQFMK